MVAATRTEALRIIDRLDLQPYVEKARKSKSLKWWDVRQAQQDYRQFLLLVWRNYQIGNPEFVVPTERADAIWHEHILHTADYRSFCTELVGTYIDHSPGLQKGTAKFNRAVQHTRSLQRESQSSGGDYTTSYLSSCGSVSTPSSSSDSCPSSCGSAGSSCGGGGGCGGGCGG